MQPLLLEPDFTFLQIQQEARSQEVGLRLRLTADDATQTRPMISNARHWKVAQYIVILKCGLCTCNLRMTRGLEQMQRKTQGCI